MKYDGQQEIGSRLGSLFAHQLLEKGLFTDVEVIVPVPLHHTRERRRGYNQSLYIARGLAEVFKCRANGRKLQRVVSTATQTKKARYERAANVEAVFQCEDPSYFRGRVVMLVDDVVTTGSTLEAAGRVLLEAEVSKLYVVTLACPEE